MKVLIACEFSGIVRDAFSSLGHDAYSCDVIESERNGKHIKDNIFLHLNDGWDLIIAHPPCTHLAVSGARWFASKHLEQSMAIHFVRSLYSAPVKYLAIENPISILSSKWRKPDQIIQPWMFGHGETKATCLWLRGLPKLIPTDIVSGRYGRVWKEAPSENRWKNRSRTLPGIAAAMAAQWGNLDA